MGISRFSGFNSEIRTNLENTKRHSYGLIVKIENPCVTLSKHIPSSALVYFAGLIETEMAGENKSTTVQTK